MTLEYKALSAEQADDLRSRWFEQRIVELTAQQTAQQFEVQRLERDVTGLDGDARVQKEAQHVQAVLASEQIEKAIQQAREELGALS